MSGTIHNPIHGLYIKQAFGKSLYKGEDAWLQQPGLSWKPSSNHQDCSVDYDLFGVFDGHGGKQAAAFASKHVLPLLQQELAGIKVKTETALPDEIQEYSQLSEDDKHVWQTQDAIIQHLPKALVCTFNNVQEEFHQHTKVSGSTATVAVIVGWDLLVASVGDSEAYLDTGAEVIQVSDTHRLDDNKAERKRCEDAGYEVCRSTVDGKPVGPERVWPGGLAMSRTIGDHMAGDVVLPEPEVRRIALPSKGARLIIASDGLWDAMNPKTAVHHVRGMPAGKAAGELVQAALKSKGLRDDITILVIDAMPDDSYRLPPYLAKTNGGHAPSVENVGSIDWHKPLDEAAAAETCASNTWERRIAAVQAEYGLPGRSSSGHSSDTNAEDLYSAQSDSAINSSVFTSPEPLLEEDSADWETVPVKPKREGAASLSTSVSASAATSPDGWADSATDDDTAGQWKIFNKQTKLNRQPDNSPAVGNGIKALRESQDIRSHPHGDDSEGDRRQRGNRGRGRGRGQGRGRGRGRRHDHAPQHQQDQSQQEEQGADSWTSNSNAGAVRSSPEGALSTSWGAETVFPISQSPITPSPLDHAESTGTGPRVLTIPRPPQTRSMTNADGRKQLQNHQQQQQRRGNRDNFGRGGSRNSNGGRGRQNAHPNHVQSGPVYDKADKPASQNISFGNFGADDFGSAFLAGVAKPVAGGGPGSNDVYHQEQEHVSRQQPHRGSFRGRGRSQSRGKGRSNNNSRQGVNQTQPAIPAAN